MVKSDIEQTNEQIPLYMLRSNLEQQIESLKKKPYNAILGFMNELFNTSHKSLTLFKFIDIEKYDIDEMKDVIKSHKKSINKYCGFDMDVSKTTHKYVILCLKKILHSIDYSFSKKMDTGTYTVKNN